MSFLENQDKFGDRKVWENNYAGKQKGLHIGLPLKRNCVIAIKNETVAPPESGLLRALPGFDCLLPLCQDYSL